ncbi:flagellar hook-associated protein 3 FlgL [Rhodovulum bhavnagarense]|uniref:Flagellar hook-associated protein 3 FlgL n=1 Tax=Rhodovulum bhavnagarense TaxID=992286 RepID=A0A4R2RD48_9RHOB|nr:flagellar hook-associated protein FlgL [Rhodovulum bhavnagarense]TCP61342.1 flagellar hook-associated protein 3 FlgL [Rhodovulum bhavnagarense]
MTIGNALFSELNIASFSRQQSGISDLQDRISAGVNDPRASADPMRAARLSVARERQDELDRYEGNLEQVSNRLDHADTVLSGANTISQRLYEIALNAANDTVSPDAREALRLEVLELREGLIDLANARDGTGSALFSGLRGVATPFAEDAAGRVEYHGDGMVGTLRVSASRQMATGLSGAEVFMGVDPGTGSGRDVFSLIDDLAVSLKDGTANLPDLFSAEGAMRLSLSPGRIPAQWSIALAGPGGSATISAELSADTPGAMVDAINARMADTGISAVLSPDGQSFDLSAAGVIVVSEVNGPQELPTDEIVARAVALDDSAQPAGPETALIPERLRQSAQVDAMAAIADHFADMRARIGALGQVADIQSRAVEAQQVMLKTAVSGLEDLDIAAAITELQQRLLTQQASQQSFIKIAQQSLFDYLR